MERSRQRPVPGSTAGSDAPGRAWRVATVLVLALLGAVVADAWGSSSTAAVGRADGLSVAIAARSDRVDQLERERDELAQQVNAAESAPGDATTRDAAARVGMLAASAGSLAVRGPGVEVTLEDAPPPNSERDLPDGVSLDDYVVHQQDVDAVINALWAGGAEAVAVMDRRIIATSSVRCVGNVVIVDGQVFSPPFVITAIGSPESMLAALDGDEGVQVFRDWADFLGLGYAAVSADELLVPAATGPPDLQFAEPVPGTLDP